jgi:hypothetical protein
MDARSGGLQMATNEAKYALYLRDLGAVLKERALATRKRRGVERTDFENGRLIAYYEVLSTMRNQAEIFDLSAEDLNLHDIDPDRGLL